MISSIIKSSNIGITEAEPIKNFFLGVTPKIMKPLDRIFQKYIFNQKQKIENFRLRIEFLEKSVIFLITSENPNDFLILEIQLTQPDFFTETFFFTEKEIKEIANESIFNRRFTINLKSFMDLIQMDYHNYQYILFNFDNFKNLLNFKTVISPRSQLWLKEVINFFNEEYMLINEFEGEILFEGKFNLSTFFEVIRWYEDVEEGGCEYKLFFELDEEENFVNIVARNFAKIEYGIEEIRIPLDIINPLGLKNEDDFVEENDNRNRKVFNLKESFPENQEKVLYSWEKYMSIFNLFKNQINKLNKSVINKFVNLTFYDNYAILFDFEFMEGNIRAKTILYPIYDEEDNEENSEDEGSINIEENSY